MNKIKLSLLFVFALLLAGCEVDNDDENEQIIFSDSGEFAEIDDRDEYDLKITGDENTIVLKGELGEVFIVGSGNKVSIEEDSYIESVTILGDDNTLYEDGVETTLNVIDLSGIFNTVSVSEFNHLNDTGRGNQVIGAMTELSGEDEATMIEIGSESIIY